MALTQVPPALLTATTGTGSTVVLSASPTFTGTVTTPSVTFSDASTQTAAASPYVLKNRIINGAMVIDQRNAGASVTPTATTYTLDRWSLEISEASKLSVQQNAGAVTPPTGFSNYLGITTVSAFSVVAASQFQLRQFIEGFNIADLAWGTANAKTATLSFWVRSSLTGTFGGAFRNEGNNRSYPFSYTISSANTWTQISITVAGDTTGTWLTNNDRGITVLFGLGVGSDKSGTAGAWAASNLTSVTGAVSVVGTGSATWYITGVQLEIGTTATPFERRLYNQELANCQRYYEKSFAIQTAPQHGLGPSNNGTIYAMGGVAYSTVAIRTIQYKFSVTKRAAPTMTFYSPAAGQGGAADGNWTSYISGVWANSTSTGVVDGITHEFAFAVELARSGVTTGYSYLTGGNWTASAEL